MNLILSKQRKLMFGAYLVLLNLYDVFITRHIIGSGKGVEANPIMAPLVEGNWALVLKVLVPLWLVAGCYFTKPEEERSAARVLTFALVGYTLLVSWNTYIHFKR